MPREHYLFVTGRLAEHALREIVTRLAGEVGFDFTIEVLPITVAALMSPPWIAKHWRAHPHVTSILIPGYCYGDLTEIERLARVPVRRGPSDLRRLPQFFGKQHEREELGQYDIQILAEINHAPRQSLEATLKQAQAYAANGADLIDIGCDPGATWSQVGDCVRMLRDQGLRVSIDSLNPAEISAATQAGAELVLSVNSSNREAAVDWDCEVVVIPDEPATLRELDETIDYLARRNVRLRIDPILEPIGCGFAASLGRYAEIRRRYPDAEMLMGIGNLTELTDVDSSGVNVLLLGFCAELGIRSVLTTQVIPWAQTSVRECDLARRLVHYAVQKKVPPKHLDPSLVMLRDPAVPQFGDEELARLAENIKDNNYRIFAENGLLHLVSRQLHLADRDPFWLFERLLHPGQANPADAHSPPKNIDPAHAFYLGFELAKASIALTLGKEYQQDEALNWGMLTVEEESHRLKRERNDPPSQ